MSLQPIKLPSGYFALPSFRFMGLTAVSRLKSEEGLWYAHPATMALSNLLAHQQLGTQTMSEEISGRVLLRAAKDLGRVIALAWLAGSAELEGWLQVWRDALKECFPEDHQVLAQRAGDGLRELLENPDALEQARHANDYGLLRGFGVDVTQMSVIGEQLFAFVLKPLGESPQKSSRLPSYGLSDWIFIVAPDIRGTMSNSIPAEYRGWWRITETGTWAARGLDVLGPALMSLTGNGDRLRMHSLVAHIIPRVTKTGVSFRWEGSWEYDSLSGTGRVQLSKDGLLKGVLRIKGGDQSTFVAEQTDPPRKGIEEPPSYRDKWGRGRS